MKTYTYVISEIHENDAYHCTTILIGKKINPMNLRPNPEKIGYFSGFADVDDRFSPYCFYGVKFKKIVGKKIGGQS